MGLTDYHVHSSFSKDAHIPLAQMCQRAEQMGLTKICFTEHLDLGARDVFNINDPGAYIDAIGQMRREYPHMFIGLGVELGAMKASHEQELTLLEQLPLDYFLLSCHDAGGFDPYDSACYKDKTRDEAVCAYLTSLYTATQLYDSFDALAHIGYLYRYLARYELYNPWERTYQPGDCPEIIDAILQKVIRVGAALEINMSEYGKNKMTMAPLSIFKRYVNLGGQTAIYGSDAHDTRSIARYYHEAKELLCQVGIRYLATYHNRVQELEKLF